MLKIIKRELSNDPDSLKYIHNNIFNYLFNNLLNELIVERNIIIFQN